MRLSFLVELRRRNIFRVAATYLVATWLIVQVVSVIDAPLNLPDWFDTVVVVLLAIGFPIAIVFAWAFELTPDGIRTTKPSSKDDSKPTNSLDYALIVALLVVAGAFLWDRFDTADSAVPAAAAPLPLDKSIAVLPFADLSPDGDQEYFGDGIAEELLNELTRLDGLIVAGRAASFAFKGRTPDIRTIGETLNVNLILSGSVRKDVNTIRVTAQLINAADGYQFWSQTYDRDLEDIFAIQDDIAASIAGVLGVTLGVGDVNSFSGAGTDSFEAYEAYLQANAISIQSEERVRAFERAVALDPDYAAALSALGLSIASTMWQNPPERAPEILERANPYLRRAIEVSPDSAFAHSLRAAVTSNFAWGESEYHTQQALAISRTGRYLHSYGNRLMRSGRSSFAIRMYSEADSANRDPRPVTNLRLNAYLALERYAEAREQAAELRDRRSFDYLLALNERDDEAIEAAIAALPRTSPRVTEIGTPLLPIMESRDEAVALLRSVFAETDNMWPSKYHDIALLAAYFGEPEFALEVFSNELRFTTSRYGALWYPVMREVRQLPQFKQLMVDVNLLEYWREYGWPDHCRATGSDDFECF